MTKVLIDADPGTDDALALIMALNSPDVDVAGVTTVGGNATLAHTTRNALRVLEYLHRPDVPVHRGSARPLTARLGWASACRPRSQSRTPCEPWTLSGKWSPLFLSKSR